MLGIAPFPSLFFAYEPFNCNPNCVRARNRMFPAVCVELFQRFFIDADAHAVRLGMIGRSAEFLVGQEITSFLFDNIIIYLCRTKVKCFTHRYLWKSCAHGKIFVREARKVLCVGSETAGFLWEDRRFLHFSLRLLMPSRIASGWVF